jgi:cell wall-associated NlpC family hydrolase
MPRSHNRAPSAAALVLWVVFLTPAACLARENHPPTQSTEAAPTAAARVLQSAQDVASFALGLIGVNYRFGGETPAVGLDCSGLIRYVFQEVTGVTLPRTARELSGLGKKVAVTDLQPGDLVFFNTRRFAFSHVGIYLGDNQFIHAPRSGSEVSVVTFSTYWQKHFNGARRLVGVLPALVPTLVPNVITPAAAGDLAQTEPGTAADNATAPTTTEAHAD